MEFTHVNIHGDYQMVDISDKKLTHRTAKASGEIIMDSQTLIKISENRLQKGDVLSVAQLAGILATKYTAHLIPLCHQINIASTNVFFNILEDRIVAVCECKTTYGTGIEMESLLGVNIALLTIYDMCKSIDKSMIITNVKLLSKTGGKSGDFFNDTK